MLSWISDGLSGTILWILIRFLIILGTAALLFVFVCGCISLSNILAPSKLFRKLRRKTRDNLLSEVNQNIDTLENNIKEIAVLVGYETDVDRQRISSINPDFRKHSDAAKEQIENLKKKIGNLNFIIRKIQPNILKITEATQNTAKQQSSSRSSLSVASIENSPDSTSTNKCAEDRQQNNWQEQNKDSYISRQPHDFYYSTEGIINELIGYYNDAVIQTNLRNDFLAKYKPEYFDTLNAKERQHNFNSPPIFETSGNGVFMAVKIDNFYHVFPRFGFSLKRINYFAGAIKDVFICDGFDQDLTYSKVEVIEPAKFGDKNGGWLLKNPGRLAIGQGE